MTVQTHVSQARTRIQAEQEAVGAKLEALDAFVDRVSDLSTGAVRSSASGMTSTTGALAQTDPKAGSRCRAVRRAFAETIRPVSVDDGSESLLTTIQTELSDEIAVALAPTSDAPFSTTLKEAILSEATARRAEAAVLRESLSREAAQIEAVEAAIDDITDWIAKADETPLLDLGFDELKQRHETLARHRDRCDRLAQQRQEFLGRTTNRGVEVGIRHRTLPPYLYRDFPDDHPVLATVARLDAVCAECQRAVRGHLVRRI
jgi:hypothetical protein